MSGIRSRPILCGAMILAATASCTSGDPADPERASRGGASPADLSAAIVTDTSEYRLSHDGRIGFSANIPFSFRNPLADTVYVVNCRGGLEMALERRDGGAWREYWSPIMLLCLSDPIVIPPGTTYRDTARVVGVLPGHNAAPEFGSDHPEGTYRLRWRNVVLHYGDYEPGRGFGDPVPDSLTFSNAFDLDDPRE